MPHSRFLPSPTLEHLRSVVRSSRSPGPGRAGWARFQQRRAAALVAHCNANVALYREHWRGVDPRDAPFEALPPISKDDFRARPPSDALAAGTDAARLVLRTTSGSSGQPFAIRRTSTEDHLMQFYRMRAESIGGVRRADRILKFAQLPAGGVRQTLPGRFRRALRLYRDETIDGLVAGSRLLDELDRRRPDVVRAYPSTLLAIAHELARRGRRGTGVRIVVAGGEELGPGARRTIGEALGARVFGIYGMSEFNLLAWECPAGEGFHVCDDNVLVEVLDSNGRAVVQGDAGEVVATALNAWTMPFVRYRTGDLATRGPAPCRCGAPWSTLSALQGRVGELLRRPDGSLVHPYRITGAIADDDADWIVQHQLVQESLDRVVLSVATRRAPTPAEWERLRATGAAALGPAMRFELETVERFTQPPGEKFAPYLSRLEGVARPASPA